VKKIKTIGALTLGILLVVLVIGCDNEQTAPECSRPDHVDPVDWDGTKDGGFELPPLGDGPSREWPHAGFEAARRSVGSDLRAHDHTIIMEAVLQNARDIAARLPQNQVSSGTEVLSAALEVPGISTHVKSRIRMVLNVLPSVEEAQGVMPEEAQQAVLDAMEQIGDCETLPQMVETMQSMIESGRYSGIDGLTQGLSAGIQILRDGEKTVYRPRALFSLKRMVQQDLRGAIGGAIGGAIVGGPPGAGVGAAAGAAGSSASDAIGQLTGWW
jgi:hypothetical protein